MGQRPAQRVAEGTSIDTTSDTEHTEWIEPELFLVDIAPFASEKEEMVLEAKRHTDGLDRISF